MPDEYPPWYAATWEKRNELYELTEAITELYRDWLHHNATSAEMRNMLDRLEDRLADMRKDPELSKAHSGSF